MLRDAEPKDRGALADLWVAAWTLAMPDIDFEARRAWFGHHLDRLEEAGARLLVAEAGGLPVGFVTVDPSRRHLDQLAVHPQHQGTSVARRLMEAAKALSPEGLSLDVNAENARARRFYARQGFIEGASATNAMSGRPILNLRWPGPGAAQVNSACPHPFGVEQK